MIIQAQRFTCNWRLPYAATYRFY